MVYWLEAKPLKTIETILSDPRMTEEQRKAIEAVDRVNVLRGASPGTRLNYVRFANRFARFCGKPLEKVTKEDIESFFMQACKVRVPEGLPGLQATAKVFFTLLLNPSGDGTPEVVSWLKCDRRSKTKKLPQNLLTPEEAKKLVLVVDHPRDKAVLAMLYESACRVSELCGLKVGDVEFNEYGAHITVNGKTGSRRILLLTSVPFLQQWLKMHPWAFDRSAPLFTRLGFRNPRPLQPEGVRCVLRAVVAKAAINKRVHCHLFRHSRLTELAKALLPFELKVFAGWTDNSIMAETYIHLSGADVDRKLLMVAGKLPTDNGRQDPPKEDVQGQGKQKPVTDQDARH